MGLFGPSSPFDTDVEKATSETNTSEQWDVIIDICDKAGSNSKNAKDCLRSIMRRMGHNDPHVAIQAITLLDACIKNCGKSFHLEIASREFENEFRRLMTKAPAAVALKMRVSLKKWAENEFKTDTQLNLIPTLYQMLKSEGYDFTEVSGPPVKSAPVLSKDPNVVSSQQEEDDIAKAIELSLKEKDGTNGGGSKSYVSSSYPTLYPSMALGDNNHGRSSSNTASKYTPEPRKVRALYDFEAAEDNELTFSAGEIIYVLDDGDPNWWKGYNDRGEGLFPSNFVTADLSVEPESTRFDTNKKTVQFSDEDEKAAKQETVEIDESKIDKLLYLLHEANPEDPSQDPQEMYILEAQVNQMLPLIDTELERVDRNHARLTQLSGNLVDAINMYHTLMREADIQLGSYGMDPHQYGPQSHPNSGMYNIHHPPNMYSPPHGYQLQPSVGNGMPMHNAMMGTLPQQHLRQMIPPHLQNGHQSLDHSSLPNTINPNMLPSHSMQMHPVPQHIHNTQQHLPQQQQQLPQQPNQHSNSPLHSIANQGPTPHQPIQMIPGMQNSSQPQIQNQQQQQQQQQQQHLHQQQPQQQQPHPAIQQNISMPQTAPINHNYVAPNSMLPPNFQHPAAASQIPQMNSQPPTNPTMSVPQFLPNTVMTTQIQQGQQISSPSSLPNHSQMNSSPIHHILPNHQLAAINQPVTSTILPQSDSRTNIPIYQQQR